MKETKQKQKAKLEKKACELAIDKSVIFFQKEKK